MNRIEYIRMTKNVSMSGPRLAPGAVPGENPYEDEFGIMPLVEMQRILNKVLCRKGNGTKATGFTLKEVQREARITCHRPLQRIADGKTLATLPVTVRPGRIPLRRLSQFLTKFERGMVVKRDGKVVYLDEAEAVRKPDMVFRVSLVEDSRGNIRPTIVRGPQLPALRQMPKLFAEFKLPGAK